MAEPSGRPEQQEQRDELQDGFGFAGARGGCSITGLGAPSRNQQFTSKQKPHSPNRQSICAGEPEQGGCNQHLVRKRIQACPPAAPPSGKARQPSICRIAETGKKKTPPGSSKPAELQGQDQWQADDGTPHSESVGKGAKDQRGACNQSLSDHIHLLASQDGEIGREQTGKFCLFRLSI